MPHDPPSTPLPELDDLDALSRIRRAQAVRDKQTRLVFAVSSIVCLLVVGILVFAMMAASPTTGAPARSAAMSTTADPTGRDAGA